MLIFVAVCCSALQCVAVTSKCTQIESRVKSRFTTLQHAATHCNMQQRIATYCNTLQHAATRCNTPCNILQHTSTHYNTLQHTHIHCNTQHHKIPRARSLRMHSDRKTRLKRQFTQNMPTSQHLTCVSDIHIQSQLQPYIESVAAMYTTLQSYL